MLWVLSCAMLWNGIGMCCAVLSYMYTDLWARARARRIRGCWNTSRRIVASEWWCCCLVCISLLSKAVDTTTIVCDFFYILQAIRAASFFLHSFICLIVCLFVIVAVIIDVISFKNDTRIAVWFYWCCCCAAVVFSRWFSRQSFQIETSTCFGFFLRSSKLGEN